MALGTIGRELDDTASFNRIKAADVRPCSNAGWTLIRERELILEQVGQYFLPDTHLTSMLGQVDAERLKAERYNRTKALFLALDMDGSYEGWRHRQRIPRGERPLRELQVRLTDGRRWSLLAYIKAMEVGSSWLAGELPAMMRAVRDFNTHRRRQPKDHPEPDVSRSATTHVNSKKRE